VLLELCAVCDPDAFDVFGLATPPLCGEVLETVVAAIDVVGTLFFDELVFAFIFVVDVVVVVRLDGLAVWALPPEGGVTA
jgi:hypothetical protein